MLKKVGKPNIWICAEFKGILRTSDDAAALSLSYSLDLGKLAMPALLLSALHLKVICPSFSYPPFHPKL